MVSDAITLLLGAAKAQMDWEHEQGSRYREEIVSIGDVNLDVRRILSVQITQSNFYGQPYTYSMLVSYGGEDYVEYQLNDLSPADMVLFLARVLGITSKINVRGNYENS